MVAVAFLAWLSFFTAGAIVGTAPYRDRISPLGPEIKGLTGGHAKNPLTDSLSTTRIHSSSFEIHGQTVDGTIEAPNSRSTISLHIAWLVVLTCYTPANVAILSTLAGLIGVLGSRASLHHNDGDELVLDNINPYLSAIMRGFFVYLVVISGVLVLIDDPFSDPTPRQYLRLAGFVSLLSFLTNYHPHFFTRFLGQITRVVQNRTNTENN